MKKSVIHPLALACLLLGATASQAQTRQLLLVASESKVELREGAVAVRQADTQDSLTVYDISAGPAKLLGRVDLPASVVGPPQSVALAPDLSLAIVTGATRLDPADKTKVIDGLNLSMLVRHHLPHVQQLCE